MRRAKIIKDILNNLDKRVEMLHQDNVDLYNKIIIENNRQNTFYSKLRESDMKTREKDINIIESLVKQRYTDKEYFDGAIIAPKNHIPILINHGEIIKMDNVKSFNISWNREDYGFYIDIEYR